jgi:hypothetical protein
MPGVQVDFTEWLPDLGELNNPGLPYVLNVLPHARGFRSFPSLTQYSTALPGSLRARGGIAAKDKDIRQVLIAGDANDLYELVASGWTTRSGSAGVYTSGTEDRWEFTLWDNQIIASNFADNLQTYDMANTAVGFTTLAGSHPKAKHITTVRDFVVVGNVNDTTDGLVPNRVQWCDFQDETTWTVGAGQAANKDLKGEGGQIQRVFGGEFGVVMQEYTSHRMTYVGAPIVWEFDEVQSRNGLLAPGLAAQKGNMIFYLSQRGFQVLEDGQRVEQIGANKIDDFVITDLDQDYLYRCDSIVDPQSTLVLFVYPGQGNVSGRPNKMVVFDYTTGRWGYAEQSADIFMPVGTIGYTLDELDAVSSAVDFLPASLDSAIWQGGRLSVGAFNASGQLGFYSGTSLPATFVSPEFEMTPGKQTTLTRVRPMIDGGNGNPTIQVNVASRRRQQDNESYVYPSAQAVNSGGSFTLRKNARYHRVRIQTAGNWAEAYGFRVDGFPGGWR